MADQSCPANRTRSQSRGRPNTNKTQIRPLAPSNVAPGAGGVEDGDEKEDDNPDVNPEEEEDN